MAQTVLLGLGGTGSRVMNNVAKILQEKGIGINDGKVCCAVLDTDTNDQNLLRESGAAIPVISTSIANWNVDQYLDTHEERKEWMPYCDGLGATNMTSGAAQMRAKSRLAFSEFLEGGSVKKLENEIDRVLRENEEGDIRVLVISSVAGGTGAGLFIQVGLWLRRYFARKQRSALLRGVFLLPDIFVRTVKTIKNSSKEQEKVYANAYAAIRELNAIDKLRMNPNESAPLPIRIAEEGLFDSEGDRGEAKRVYDQTFLIDEEPAQGAAFSSIGDYEHLAAEMIYLQLYAPMADTINSAEDNLMSEMLKSPEPMFGSCGTAKAVYPKEDVLEYCALRTVKEAISDRWLYLDREIQNIQKQRKEEEERTGRSTAVDARAEYIRLFRQEAGNDDTDSSHKFFNRIKAGAADEDGALEDLNGVGGKAGEFMEKHLFGTVRKKVEEQYEKYSTLEKAARFEYKEEKFDLDAAKRGVEGRETLIGAFLKDVETNTGYLADGLAEEICPTNIEKMDARKENSLYAYLAKDGSFAHPVVLRYLLLTLAGKMEREKERTGEVKELAQAAKQGYPVGGCPISFDNPATGTVEKDPLAYLNSRTFLQCVLDVGFVNRFREQYKSYRDQRYTLCKEYAEAALRQKTAELLLKRIDALLGITEEFFKALPRLSGEQGELEEKLEDNLDKKNRDSQNIKFIFASPEDKERLYDSLKIDSAENNPRINEIVAKLLYGTFCDQWRKGQSKAVGDAFLEEAVSAYKQDILDKHRSAIDLDIISAFEKSLRLASKDLKMFPQEIGDLRERLKGKAMPYLQAEGADDAPQDHKAAIAKEPETYWGLHPETAKKIPEDAQGEFNLERSMDEAYPKNELCCFRLKHGYWAEDIRKLNELKNGIYYKSYQAILSGLLHGEYEVCNPHLDKTWHYALPYISQGMREKKAKEFYRSFWQALAYGKVYLDKKEDAFYIRRPEKNQSGQETEVHEKLLWKGEKIGKVDIPDLLEALRRSGPFLLLAESLEETFQKDCKAAESNTNYVDLPFMKGEGIDNKGTCRGGLCSEDGDTNGVTVITRYHKNPHHSDAVTAQLADTLQALCRELVESRDGKGSDDLVHKRCVEIYEKGMTGKDDVRELASWRKPAHNR